MKIRNLLCLLFLSLMFASCSTDDGVYTKPITLYEKVAGTWNLSRVKQVDEVAAAAKAGTTEMDLTDFFENFTISLNEDSEGNPTTFSATGGPAILPQEGFWKLERPFQNWDGTPVKVLFYSDAACTNQTGNVQITAVPGSVPSMELKMTRYANGSAFVSYVYTLIPINQ